MFKRKFSCGSRADALQTSRSVISHYRPIRKTDRNVTNWAKFDWRLKRSLHNTEPQSKYTSSHFRAWSDLKAATDLKLFNVNISCGTHHSPEPIGEFKREVLLSAFSTACWPLSCFEILRGFLTLFFTGELIRIELCSFFEWTSCLRPSMGSDGLLSLEATTKSS